MDASENKKPANWMNRNLSQTIFGRWVKAIYIGFTLGVVFFWTWLLGIDLIELLKETDFTRIDKWVLIKLSTRAGFFTLLISVFPYAFFESSKTRKFPRTCRFFRMLIGFGLGWICFGVLVILWVFIEAMLMIFF